MTLDPRLQKYVRYAEAAVIVVLLAFALITYRELSTLRKYPVVLPTYDFEVGSDGGDLVKTRGTWTSQGGVPGTLGTSSIECGKSAMRCVESTAQVVFISGRGVLESSLAQFDIDRWTDKEIVAKPYAVRCTTRTLVLDLVKKRAHSSSTPNPDVSNCEQTSARSFDLVAGYSSRAE
jgi:hypothetical protein